MEKLQGIVSEVIKGNRTMKDNVVQFPTTGRTSAPVRSDNIIGMSNAIYVPTTTKGDARMTEKPRSEKVTRFAIGFTAATVLLAFAIFGASQLIGGQGSLEDNIEYIMVSVDSGDTVWSLIQENNPEYNGDIRPLVDLAKKRNDGSVQIASGEMIAIPVVKEVK